MVDWSYFDILRSQGVWGQPPSHRRLVPQASQMIFEPNSTYYLEIGLKSPRNAQKEVGISLFENNVFPMFRFFQMLVLRVKCSPGCYSNQYALNIAKIGRVDALPGNHVYF